MNLRSGAQHSLEPELSVVYMLNNAVGEERKKRIFALSDIDDFLMSKNVSSAFPEHGFERPLLVQCR